MQPPCDHLECFKQSFYFHPTNFLRDGDEDGALLQSKDRQECRGACMKSIISICLLLKPCLEGSLRKELEGDMTFARVLMAVLKKMMHSPAIGMAPHCF